MSRGILTKIDIESYVYKLKQQLLSENTHHSKELADKYLNKVLDKINEYRG